ncbi:MAG: hypothetical protein CSA05_00890 [Bacteroidia bacterium]|nr:MAG: hypothetical protein CSA05_00890 [Bacteroidia bacterium]
MYRCERTIKVEHFKNLVAVAVADGTFSEDEMEFLKKRAQEYGINERKVYEIMQYADKLQFEVPLNKFEKEEQLADIVYISMIDGQIHDKEYELCLKIAERLDLTQKYLDQIIELTKKLWE